MARGGGSRKRENILAPPLLHTTPPAAMTRSARPLPGRPALLPRLAHLRHLQAGLERCLYVRRHSVTTASLSQSGLQLQHRDRSLQNVRLLQHHHNLRSDPVPRRAGTIPTGALMRCSGALAFAEMIMGGNTGTTTSAVGLGSMRMKRNSYISTTYNVGSSHSISKTCKTIHRGGLRR